MPKELKNITIEEISLVKRGANRKKFFILKKAKDADAPPQAQTKPPEVPTPVNKGEGLHCSLSVSYNVDPYATVPMNDEEKAKVRKVIATLQSLIGEAGDVQKSASDKQFKKAVSEYVDCVESTVSFKPGHALFEQLVGVIKKQGQLLKKITQENQDNDR